MAKYQNIEEYWQEFRRTIVELDPESAEADAKERLYKPKHKFEIIDASRKPVYLTAVNANVDGKHNLFVCVPYNATQRLVDGTHRLATPEEIATWKKKQADAKETIENAERTKQQPLVAELVAALRPTAAEPTQSARPKSAA